jgi:hypothetical protein
VKRWTQNMPAGILDQFRTISQAEYAIKHCNLTADSITNVARTSEIEATHVETFVQPVSFRSWYNYCGSNESQYGGSDCLIEQRPEPDDFAQIIRKHQFNAAIVESLGCNHRSNHRIGVVVTCLQSWSWGIGAALF